ncbi:MAG: hypothetical protein MZV70_33515 [Desulfobacterales bacterium]|nr:hypothetical protein [Desulfobacterales bacterium]
MPYIVKGFTHQLMKSVRRTGLPLLPARTTLPKSIFTIMGYIIMNRQIAMGMETTGAPPTVIDMESRVLAKVGAALPSSIPATIQSATHTVRYFSKGLLILLSAIGTPP